MPLCIVVPPFGGMQILDYPAKTLMARMSDWPHLPCLSLRKFDVWVSRLHMVQHITSLHFALPTTRQTVRAGV